MKKMRYEFKQTDVHFMAESFYFYYFSFKTPLTCKFTKRLLSKIEWKSFIFLAMARKYWGLSFTFI